jgi:hypothetical protein
LIAGLIGWICEHNKALRDELNKIVVGSYRSLTPVQKKERVRESFLHYPDILTQVIEAYEQVGAKFYDFRDDPAGETIWYRISKTLTSKSALAPTLPAKPTIDEVFGVAKAICEHFKRLIEDNQLCRLLYDKQGHRKHESAAQLLFFGVATAYCEANDLDLSPESDGGRGPVDFKVSAGFKGKVLVEIKLTSNLQLAHGFEKQLPIYQTAERSYRGIYLVINNGGITEARWDAFSEIVKAAGGTAPIVMIVDGAIRRSASKAEC